MMNETTPFPIIETGRLILREVAKADAETLFAILGDPIAMQYFGKDPLTDLAAAQALIHTIIDGRNSPTPATRWAIQIKGESHLIGTCGLFNWNRDWHRCMVGYELATLSQGKGYMLEALSALFNWGFVHMQLNRIDAQIHPNNKASLALAKTLGFVEEGRLREMGYWGGQYHDMLQLSLLRREWQSYIDSNK